MNPRSKKYYESRKAERNTKKGSSTGAGYNETDPKSPSQPNENPAPPKSQEQPKETGIADQDDTAGPNGSGIRSDDN